MYYEEEDKLVSCPYNPRHVIRSSRLPYHIVKCKAAHPNIKLDACAYNFSHLIEMGKMNEHLEMCPSKVRLEPILYCDNSNVTQSCFKKRDKVMSALEEASTLYYVSKPMRNRRKEMMTHSACNSLEQGNCGKHVKVIQGESDNHVQSSQQCSSKSEKCADVWLDNDEVPEPLPLPKTVSKAFKLRESNK